MLRSAAMIAQATGCDMSKQPEGPVAEEVQRQNKEAAKGVRHVGERANEIAEQTEKNDAGTSLPPFKE